jgi:hypothetical protein
MTRRTDDPYTALTAAIWRLTEVLKSFLSE